MNGEVVNEDGIFVQNKRGFNVTFSLAKSSDKLE